ncbi:MAG TPA: sugar-binding transcriptional regulator [Thermoflexia bacterium]|nr:sugar-binding transcriptional regulator [Thermoflexia bacterium]
MDHEELLAHIASLYYEEDLTQAEIARRIGTSRSTVSRMLREARDAGIVEIIIHHPWRTVPELERELVRRFHLHQARVLQAQGRPYSEVLKGLGVLAARHIDNILADGMTFGISWGTAVFSTVQALRPKRRLSIRVVQMIGAVGTSDPLIDGPDLARLLASVYGGEYRYLHAPLIVESPQVREALLQEPHIRETLDIARKADLALVGIGSPRPEVSSLLRAGYLDREALARLREQGVVGDICARHYDIRGRILDIPLNRRIVGIEPEDIHTIGQVIGVAGGAAKAEAILGALRGGCVDVLITDDTAAERVLALDETEG